MDEPGAIATAGTPHCEDFRTLFRLRAASGNLDPVEGRALPPRAAQTLALALSPQKGYRNRTIPGGVQTGKNRLEDKWWATLGSNQ